MENCHVGVWSRGKGRDKHLPIAIFEDESSDSRLQMRWLRSGMLPPDRTVK